MKLSFDINEMIESGLTAEDAFSAIKNTVEDEFNKYKSETNKDEVRLALAEAIKNYCSTVFSLNENLLKTETISDFLKEVEKDPEILDLIKKAKFFFYK